MKSLKFITAALITVATLATSAVAETSKLTAKQAIHKNQITEENKALVLKAYQELFGDHDLKALDRYWATNYVQHNPTMTDGVDSVKQMLEKMGISHWPKQKVDFKRVIAEGDLVMLQVVQPKSGDMPESVVVDIFRVENSKIVEHWDVIQAVPADAVNKRAMY